MRAISKLAGIIFLLIMEKH